MTHNNSSPDNTPDNIVPLAQAFTHPTHPQPDAGILRHGQHIVIASRNAGPASVHTHPHWTTPEPPEDTPEPDITARSREIDWPLVNMFRGQVSTRLSQLEDYTDLTDEQERERGRAIIAEILDEHARRALDKGDALWTPKTQSLMAKAVFDAVFELGRLQPLLEDEDVENVEINGYDQIRLQYADGNIVVGPPIAESDEDLLGFFAFVASRHNRTFSESNPRLHLSLPGGERLAVTAWVTPRPLAVIRRHRLVEVTLDDLVARNMLTWSAAEFLRAAVRDGRSIVVAGPQGAGKTTFLRALINEIDPYEKIGTFETEFELHLHESPRWKRGVWSFEARPGSGEFGPDGRPAGEITLHDLVYDSFRFNLDRQIVGEVRGSEILAMIKTMQSSNGGLCTTHARSGRETISKLITCAMEAGSHVTESYARRAIAGSIDIVVQLTLDVTDTAGTPIRSRYVSEIVAVTNSEEQVGVEYTDVYTLEPGTTTLRPNVLPDYFRSLERFGFNMGRYLADGGREEDR